MSKISSLSLVLHFTRKVRFGGGPFYPETIMYPAFLVQKGRQTAVFLVTISFKVQAV